MPIDADKLQLLHEHYRDSCAETRATRRGRDRTSLLVLCSLVAVLFERSAPGEFGALIGNVIAEQWPGARLDLQYLSTLIWVAVLGLAIRYFQTTVRLEREYKYIHSLEELLAAEFPTPSFTREGKAYLRDYPVFSSWVHVLYQFVLPCALLVIAAARVFSTLRLPSPWPARIWADLAVSVLLVASLVLYAWSAGVRDWTRRLWGSLTRCRSRRAPRVGGRPSDGGRS